MKRLLSERGGTPVGVPTRTLRRVALRPITGLESGESFFPGGEVFLTVSTEGSLLGVNDTEVEPRTALTYREVFGATEELGALVALWSRWVRHINDLLVRVNSLDEETTAHCRCRTHQV